MAANATSLDYPRTDADAPPRFHLLAKPSGSTCNIDCKYCFVLSKDALYPYDTHRMSEATAGACIWQLIESHLGIGYRRARDDCDRHFRTDRGGETAPPARRGAARLRVCAATEPRALNSQPVAILGVFAYLTLVVTF